jgi:hypothetical protein
VVERDFALASRILRPTQTHTALCTHPWLYARIHGFMHASMAWCTHPWKPLFARKYNMHAYMYMESLAGVWGQLGSCVCVCVCVCTLIYIYIILYVCIVYTIIYTIKNICVCIHSCPVSPYALYTYDWHRQNHKCSIQSRSEVHERSWKRIREQRLFIWIPKVRLQKRPINRSLRNVTTASLNRN